eukprot:scaffold67516_cov28-Prasinocladus_malaysianus.AAC.1
MWLDAFSQKDNGSRLLNVEGKCRTICVSRSPFCRQLTADRPGSAKYKHSYDPTQLFHPPVTRPLRTAYAVCKNRAAVIRFPCRNELPTRLRQTRADRTESVQARDTDRFTLQVVPSIFTD